MQGRWGDRQSWIDGLKASRRKVEELKGNRWISSRDAEGIEGSWTVAHTHTRHRFQSKLPTSL